MIKSYWFDWENLMQSSSMMFFKVDDVLQGIRQSVLMLSVNPWFILCSKTLTRMTRCSNLLHPK
ncbi:hypothetical protein HanRHA438_Chr14g0671301 [Helianthus annuus]|nr:hypothetical protein HanRHA438_Chr14g0671301 [Helianthus annuus]